MSQPEGAGLSGSEPMSVNPRGPRAELPRRTSRQLAAGAAAAVLVVPLSLLVGRWVGSLASSTVLAALPALLVVAVLPPLAVVAAVAQACRRLEPGSPRLGGAVGVALGVQGLMLVGAVWAGVSAWRPGDMALLTLAEAVVLPAAVALRIRRPATLSPSRASSSPGLWGLLAVLLTVPRLAGAACPERDVWPTQDWPTGALPAGREQALKSFEDYAFTRVGQDAERKGIRTNGVVLVHRGRVVYERYAEGWEAGRRHLGWSMAKSVTNALTGLAVAHGALTLDDSICEHVKATNEAACAITVRHLLEFSSGLDWKEGYEDSSLQTSSVLAMLYGEGRSDMVGFITSHALRDAPGTSWQYSSGDSTLLAGVVGAAMRPRFGEGWEWKLLMEPVGVRSATFERDGQGVRVGSSLMYATPRDWAKLGLLFLQDGCWEGQRVLPEGWVAAAVAVSEPLRRKRVDWDPGDMQGRQLWLNRRAPGFQEQKPWPDVPEDAYAMRGHWGQSVTVIPSLELVVVRTADDRESGAFSLNTFLARALALVEGTP
jgi:CubicO group peptidase (beta-lactamase class C family)